MTVARTRCHIFSEFGAGVRERPLSRARRGRAVHGHGSRPMTASPSGSGRSELTGRCVKWPGVSQTPVAHRGITRRSGTPLTVPRAPRASSPASPPRGHSHPGNHVGPIRPRSRASLRPGVQSFYFLLTTRPSSARTSAHPALHRWRSLPSWLAAGLDPRRWFLPPVRHPRNPRTDLAADLRDRQGLLNRAHAYKAAQDKNAAAGRDAGRRRDRRPVHVPRAHGRRHPDVQGTTRCRWGATRCSTSRWRATWARASTTSTASTCAARKR